MCIHGDKSQPERDWVLNGESITEGTITRAAVRNLPRRAFFQLSFFCLFLYPIDIFQKNFLCLCTVNFSICVYFFFLTTQLKNYLTQRAGF